MIMSSPLNGGAGFAGQAVVKLRMLAIQRNRNECRHNCTLHFVARNSFTEVSDIVVQYVICFSRSISSAKRLPGKFQLPRWHNTDAVSRALLVRQQQRAV